MDINSSSLPAAPEVKTLLQLPPELLHRVFAWLPLYDILRLGATCRLLHAHSIQGRLWHDKIQENVQTPIESPAPLPSFKELYVQHHAHWFLTRHTLWYSDTGLAGKLMYARYNPKNGAIEGYQVHATRVPSKQTMSPGDVPIAFEVSPSKLELDVRYPVVRLETGKIDVMAAFRGEKLNAIPSRSQHRVSSVFARIHALSDSFKAQTAPTSMWPPHIIPSPGDQRALKHVNAPSRYSGMVPHIRKGGYSDAVFWLRKWISHETTERVETLVETWATLPRECYTPTEEKPWQGIWCCDYGRNGVQFLLLTQPDNPTPLPEHAQRAFETRELSTSQNAYGIVGMLAAPESDEEDEYDDEGALYGSRPAAQEQRARQMPSRSYFGPAHDDRAPYKGRLEAIKLTGDQNVPRGQYCFIAPDLGSNGLVEYGSESLFTSRQTFVHAITNGGMYINSTWETILPEFLLPEFDGARIVRCVNHMSGVYSTDDKYEPTELVMMSENRLAQYSLISSSVNFFERVDLDQFAESAR